MESLVLGLQWTLSKLLTSLKWSVRKLLWTLKWTLISILSAVLIWMMVNFVVYRAYWGGELVKFEGEVNYKFISGFNNRGMFESLLFNWSLELEGQPLVYINNADHEKVSPESPWDMRDKGYSIKATVVARPLLFGGYGVAKVKKIEYLNKTPNISKN